MRSVEEMTKARRGQDGDTFVEVLIAIAVVTSVLGIVYATMNRNLAIMRNNQERTEASKIAQSQIEAIKAAMATDAGRSRINSFDSNAPFCISLTNGDIDEISVSATPVASLQADILSSANYDTCISSFYHYVVKRNGSGLDPTFTITVRWDTLGGGRSQTQMTYRVPR